MKRTEIETSVGGLGGLERIPVLLTDKLSYDDVLDLAECSVVAGYLPYLLVGYFKNRNEKTGRCFFSNARRHSELKQAVEQEGLGGEYCAYGQIHFRNDDQLEFEKLDMHGEIANDETAQRESLTTIIRLIAPENLKDSLVIKFLTGDKSMYTWTKADEMLIKDIKRPS